MAQTWKHCYNHTNYLKDPTAGDSISVQEHGQVVPEHHRRHDAVMIIVIVMVVVMFRVLAENDRRHVRPLYERTRGKQQ